MGITTNADFLNNLEKTEEGVVAYKCFGYTVYSQPWAPKIGDVITETVNFNRVDTCGCGINIATEEWMVRNPLNLQGVWYKVLIKWIDLSDAVVPFSSDGKFRVSRCTIQDQVPPGLGDRIVRGKHG